MNTSSRRLMKHAAGYLAGVVLLSATCDTTAVASEIMPIVQIGMTGDVISPFTEALEGAKAHVAATELSEDSAHDQFIEAEVQAAAEEAAQDGEAQPAVLQAVSANSVSAAAMQEEIPTQDIETDKTVPMETEAEGAATVPASETENISLTAEQGVSKAEQAVAPVQGQQLAAASQTVPAAVSLAATGQTAPEAVSLAATSQTAPEAVQLAATGQTAPEAVQLTATGQTAPAAVQQAAPQAVSADAQQTAPVPAAAVTENDLYLLAALIECEAGGEPYVGQVAVGNVVMNRVEDMRHPSTISDVIYEPGQFTPVRNGSLSRTLATGHISDSSKQAALEAVAGSSPAGDSLFFRRVNGRHGLVIGHHVFY